MAHPEESDDLLRQGIRDYHAGDHAKAAKLFYQATQHNPANQMAWIWLAGCVKDQEKQRMCYQTALDIDSTSREGQLAAAALSKLPPLPEEVIPPPPEEVVPPPPISMERPASPPAVMLENKRIEHKPPDFISLTCPKCGGHLDVTNDTERFACGYCGTEHLVRRSGGMISLHPVAVGLQKIQYGTDRTASELAIVRLEKEIDALDAKLNAALYEERLLYTPTHHLTKEEKMQRNALVMRYRKEAPHRLPARYQTWQGFHDANGTNSNRAGCLFVLAVNSLFIFCSTVNKDGAVAVTFLGAALMFFVFYLVVKPSGKSETETPSDPPLLSAALQQQIEEKRAELREHQKRVKL